MKIARNFCFIRQIKRRKRGIYDKVAKIIFLLSCVLMAGASTPVFASEAAKAFLPPESRIHTEIGLNSMNLSKSFSETTQYTDENGTPVVITVSYTPAPATRGSSTATASSGTWTSKATYGVISMSYQFNLSKSGSEWKITNGRNLNYSGVLCSFSNPRLRISRSVSTSSSPAEINGSVTAKTAVNSAVCLLTTKISHSGTVTTIWN